MTPVNVTLFPRTGMLPRTDGYPLENMPGGGRADLHLWLVWPGELVPPGPGAHSPRQSGDPYLQISARLAASRQPPGIFRQLPVFPGIGSTGTNF